MAIKPPSPQTLLKYGLSMSEWLALWELQGERCGFCGGEHDRYVIDHEHVVQWAKRPDEERKLYVRGIIGVMENHYLLSRYMTMERAALTYEYLTRYELRRPPRAS